MTGRALCGCRFSSALASGEQGILALVTANAAGLLLVTRAREALVLGVYRSSLLLVFVGVTVDFVAGAARLGGFIAFLSVVTIPAGAVGQILL